MTKLLKVLGVLGEYLIKLLTETKRQSTYDKVEDDPAGDFIKRFDRMRTSDKDNT